MPRRRKLNLRASGVRRVDPSERPKRSPRTDLGVACVLFVVLAAFFLSYARYGINILDEGYLLGAVQRVSLGEVPYRDFAHQYAPGRFYLFSWLFDLAAPSVQLVRTVWALLLAATGALLFLLARRFAGPVAALWPALALAAAQGPWQKTPLVLGSVLLALAIVRFCERPGAPRALVVGGLAGLVLLFRQDVALYALLAFAVAALRMAFTGWPAALASTEGRGRKWLGEVSWLPPAAWVGLCALAFTLVLILPGLAFYWAGALNQAVRSILFAGLEGVRANALPFPDLMPLFPRSLGDLIEVPSRLLHYLPPVVLLVAALLALGARSVSRSAALLGLATLGLLLFRLDLDRSHAMHLLQVLPIPWVLLSAALDRWWRAHPATAGLAALVALGVLSKVGHGHYPSSVWVRAGMDAPLGLERADLVCEPNRAAALAGAVRHLQAATEPGEPVLALPDLPLIHFLADRPNPLRYDLLRAGRLRDAGDQEALIRSIDRARSRWLVWNTTAVDSELPGRRLQAHAPVVWGHLMARYEAAEEFGPYRVFRRREQKPAPRPEIVVLGIEGWTHARNGALPPTILQRSTYFELAVSPSMDAEAAWLALSSGVLPGRRRGRIEGEVNLRFLLAEAGYRVRSWDEAVDLRHHEERMAVIDRIGDGGAETALELLESALGERAGDPFIIIAGLGARSASSAGYELAATRVRGLVPGARPSGSVLRSDLTRAPLDSAIRVPLWVAGPRGGVASCAAPVSLVDVVPTLLDLLALETRERVDGISLLPLMRGMRAFPRYHYVEGGSTPRDDPRWWGVRGRAWKLLLGPGGERLLLDLSVDPGETTDLSARSRARVRRLSAIAHSSVAE